MSLLVSTGCETKIPLEPLPPMPEKTVDRIEIRETDFDPEAMARAASYAQPMSPPSDVCALTLHQATLADALREASLKTGLGIALQDADKNVALRKLDFSCLRLPSEDLLDILAILSETHYHREGDTVIYSTGLPWCEREEFCSDSIFLDPFLPIEPQTRLATETACWRFAVSCLAPQSEQVRGIVIAPKNFGREGVFLGIHAPRSGTMFLQQLFHEITHFTPQKGTLFLTPWETWLSRQKRATFRVRLKERTVRDICADIEVQSGILIFTDTKEIALDKRWSGFAPEIEGTLEKIITTIEGELNVRRIWEGKASVMLGNRPRSLAWGRDWFSRVRWKLYPIRAAVASLGEAALLERIQQKAGIGLWRTPGVAMIYLPVRNLLAVVGPENLLTDVGYALSALEMEIGMKPSTTPMLTPAPRSP